MEELKKVRRVLSRQAGGGSPRVLLTLDATTGQNGLAQARSFTDAVSCDGVFLAKLDGTAKGGMVLAITHELNLPILYIGTGEQLEDIAHFDAEDFVNALFDYVGACLAHRNRPVRTASQTDRRGTSPSRPCLKARLRVCPRLMLGGVWKVSA